MKNKRNNSTSKFKLSRVVTILDPLGWLYGSITALRNKLYDRGTFTSFEPPQFTVSVGNLTVGGTGKTPLIEYLICLLKNDAPLATLSRGYGRRSRGFLVAQPGTSARDLGDEPLQYFQKFGDLVTVTVCEDRAAGSRQIQELYPEISLLLLDDAYQHRGIRPHVNILLNDYNRPFYEDNPFPAGYLREGRAGARRADAVVVSKCPVGISEEEKGVIRRKISTYTRSGVPVFFASVRYEQPVGYLSQRVARPEAVVAMAGIARPEPFLNYLNNNFKVLKEVIYPDHHDYRQTDLETGLKSIKKGTFVITTEKDMVKLRPLAEAAGVAGHFLYLPIGMDFGTDREPFESWVNETVRKPLLRSFQGNKREI
ncbi:tetraacyldisaccharide 4'-kinase [Telluribacter sp.]|jgi:tetraacyldisaccharide 4'-kinase|uniref:tetraacyldisaccharide 4'-kinase n=1 Tax=Telluribacter sp. TaxID=1978767 RepID=UPI002E14A4BB|nr:tetraacyldisaccharide 4'-kinase [Telluribacter sp.]